MIKYEIKNKIKRKITFQRRAKLKTNLKFTKLKTNLKFIKIRKKSLKYQISLNFNFF
jgi:tRNA(Ser,Leu) C12 N-acetylase TAN1